MRTREEFLERIKGYDRVDYIYDADVGYLVFRIGTGDNVEALFLEVAEKRKGYGTELYRRMVQRMVERGEKPYHSVFAFRLTGNEEAKAFYDRLGWKQQDIGSSVYRSDGTTLMWIAWDDLCKRLGVL